MVVQLALEIWNASTLIIFLGKNRIDAMAKGSLEFHEENYGTDENDYIIVMFGSWKPKATSVHHQSFGASLGHSKTVLDSSEKQRDEPKMSQHVATGVASICVWCVLRFFGHRPAFNVSRRLMLGVSKTPCGGVGPRDLCDKTDWYWNVLNAVNAVFLSWQIELGTRKYLKRHGSWLRCHVNRPWGHGSKNSPRDPRRVRSLPQKRFLLPSAMFGLKSVKNVAQCTILANINKPS